ncbi:MAG: alpha/beta fold hydrolase [Gordonia sp. (in: high G+C Gram-positive bacteria)]
MSTAVLVHGAWHGGWCWRRVAQILTQRGWTVFTPTLTGVGDRAHLASPLVGLDTHVDDVTRLIDAEELDDIVLCGHSAAGQVVTGVADRIPDRIAHLVYLDAIVPENNQSLIDVVGDAEGLPEAFRTGAAHFGAGWLIPPTLFTAEGFGVTDPDDAAWVTRRLTPYPIRGFTDRIQLTGGITQVKRQTFARCTGFPVSAIDTLYEAFAAAPDKQAVRWEIGHDAMITHPQLVAELLTTR